MLSLRFRCRTLSGSPRPKSFKKVHFIKNMRQHDMRNGRYEGKQRSMSRSMTGLNCSLVPHITPRCSHCPGTDDRCIYSSIRPFNRYTSLCHDSYKHVVTSLSAVSLDAQRRLLLLLLFRQEARWSVSKDRATFLAPVTQSDPDYVFFFF